MDRSMLLLLGADAILVLHVLFVCFVVLGLLLVLLGRRRGWRWVRDPWFRLVHAAAIGIVVVQAWLGVLCPLTLWELRLRAQAGDAVYAGSFIAHWLERLLYFQAPAWVFLIVYSLFGAFVAASWIWVPPRPFRRRRHTGNPDDR
jgi:hypothetical protein